MNDTALRRMNTARTTGSYLADVESEDTERGAMNVQAWELGYVPLARIGGDDALRLTIDGIVIASDIETITARFGTPQSSMLIDALTHDGRAHDPLDATYHTHPFSGDELNTFEHGIQRALRYKAQFVPDPENARDRWFMKSRNGVAGHPYGNPEMRMRTAANQIRAISILAERYAELRE